MSVFSLKSTAKSYELGEMMMSEGGELSGITAKLLSDTEHYLIFMNQHIRIFSCPRSR